MTFISYAITVLTVLHIQSVVLSQTNFQSRENGNRFQNSGSFNKSVAWGQFFEAFPKIWSGITTALQQGSVTDMNIYYNQVQNVFRSGFKDPQVSLSASTPGFTTYNTEVRKALIYVGLPGSTNTANPDKSKSTIVLNYGLLTPFPLFLNKKGNLISASEEDPVWPVGPNVCLTRTFSTYRHEGVDRTKNVTHCTSARDDSQMHVLCWLPTLRVDGSVSSATKYTTLYNCCDGFSLAISPTSFPTSTFASVMDMLSFLETPVTLDKRVCQ